MLKYRLTHFLPIALMLSSSLSMAYDYVTVEGMKTIHRGFLSGIHEALDLAPELPAQVSAIAVAPGGGSLAALVNGDLYTIGGTAANTELLAHLSFAPTDLAVVNDQYLFLSADGITNFNGTIVLVPAAMLPPNATRFAVMEETPGVLLTVVAGGREVRSIRFSLTGNPIPMATTSYTKTITDISLGRHQEAPVALLVLEEDELRMAWATYLEMKPGSLPQVASAKWPHCDPIPCRPIAHKKDGTMVIVNPDDWSIEPAGSNIPAGPMVATRGATSLQPRFAVGNDGTGSGVQEPTALLDNIAWLRPGGGAGVGLRVSPGDVVSVDPEDQSGDDIVDLTIGYYSYYGSNTSSPMVRTYQEEQNVLVQKAGWDPYSDGRFGATVATTRLFPPSDPSDETPGDDVLTGPGPGPVFGPHVRAFNYQGTPYAKVSYFAYGTLKYGVNVAAPQNGLKDGTIITGAGPGTVFGPHVRGWSTASGRLEPIQRISFFAFPGSYVYGAEVASGDIGDDDAYNELLVGPGAPQGANPNLPTFQGEIRGFNYDGAAVQTIDFMPQDPTRSSYMLTGGPNGDQAEMGGARVAFGNLDYVYGAHGPDSNLTDTEIIGFNPQDPASQGVHRDFSTSFCSSGNCGVFIGSVEGD